MAFPHTDPQQTVPPQVRQLIERGRQADAFRFAPRSEEARAAVAALATAHTENRNDVLRVVIGSLSQITAFSDAFRLHR